MDEADDMLLLENVSFTTFIVYQVIYKPYRRNWGSTVADFVTCVDL